MRLFLAKFSHAEAAKPLSLPPDKPQYLLFRDRPAILITSGEGSGAGLNLDLNYIRYLDE